MNKTAILVGIILLVIGIPLCVISIKKKYIHSWRAWILIPAAIFTVLGIELILIETLKYCKVWID